MASGETQKPSEALFTFGAISDIQYADHDDVLPQFTPKLRYYRNSLTLTAKAVKEFQSRNASFILQLGDMIDGKSRSESTEAMSKVLSVLNSVEVPVFHTIGNHELYNFTHDETTQVLCNNHADQTVSQPHNASYYSFQRHNFRFIGLDCYDVSMIGRESDSEAYQLSTEYLTKNPNGDLNSPTGLKGLDRRFLMYNGGVGQTQINWLKNQLEEAEKMKERVVVFGHISLLPEVSTPENLLWNYEQILELLENSANVVLILSGHTHQYCSVVSPAGKQYISLPGVIETPPGGKAWALVDVHERSLDITVYDDHSKDKVYIPL